MNPKIHYTKPSIAELEVGYVTDAARNGWVGFTFVAPAVWFGPRNSPPPRRCSAPITHIFRRPRPNGWPMRRGYADMITLRFGLGPHSQVVELASNDAYLLRNFFASGIPCLGDRADR